MPTPAAQVVLAWRPHAPADATLRARVAEEVRQLAWTLSQMEALAHDAHRAAGHEHAFLMPRLELRLPLFDLGLRYRLVVSCMEKSHIALLDEEGRKVADVSLL